MPTLLHIDMSEQQEKEEKNLLNIKKKLKVLNKLLN
jgi:hypothetical protein